MKTLVFVTMMLISAQASAGLWDDIKGAFSGSDKVDDVEKAEAAVEAVKKVETSQPATQTGTVTQLMPLVVSQLGVTDRQARGGLGALFQASESVLSAQDFNLLKKYVPEADQLMSEAPATNSLLGGALEYAGAGQGTTAAANLLTQFNDLGLGSEMIARYSDVTGDYLKEKSPDLARTFSDSLLGLLE